MTHRPIVLVVALLVAVGVPLYFVVIKRHAASTLEDLLHERWTARVCPVTTPIEIPEGGRVTCQSAYDDKDDTGLVLVIGSWDRGQVKTQIGATYVENKVGGVWKANADEAWLAKARSQKDVIVAVPGGGGGIVIWKGLPSRNSVLAHVEAVR